MNQKEMEEKAEAEPEKSEDELKKEWAELRPAEDVQGNDGKSGGPLGKKQGEERI